MGTALEGWHHQCRVQVVITALILLASLLQYFCEELALQGPLQCMVFSVTPRAAAWGQGGWIWRIWSAEC